MNNRTWLRERRIEAGFERAEDLAVMMRPKVSGEAVRKWETMESSPRKQYYPQLARLLDVTLEDIFKYSVEVDKHLLQKRHDISLKIGGDNYGLQAGGNVVGSTIGGGAGGGLELTPAEKMFIMDNRTKGGDERLARLMAIE